MSSFDFIIENIRFSYSSTSSFDNCAYSFKLTYIDALTPRANNFFGEFGTLIHECFEQYFTDKKEAYELSQYYKENYDEMVKTPAPSSPLGMAEKYRMQGQTFFDNFSFNKQDYQVMLVEDKIDFDLPNGAKMVAKPDVVLMEKSTGDFILVDYKTATPYWNSKSTGKEMSDKKKLTGYYQQMYTYTYALRNFKITPIDKIMLWYPRLNKMVITPWSLDEETKAINHLTDLIEKIKIEEIFAYDNSQTYFCNELCGVRAFCEYR